MELQESVPDQRKEDKGAPVVQGEGKEKKNTSCVCVCVCVCETERRASCILIYL